MKVRDLLVYATSRLRAADIENAPRDARALVADVICRSKDQIILSAIESVTQRERDLLTSHLDRRITGCPVSRILGRRLFWGREFKINDNVIDPRGDTETLVALALERPAARILDLGTGSGVIAISLAAEWPSAEVIASDVSEAALKIATENARTHGVRERCSFLLSDWYSEIKGTFDLIISNPPYVTQKSMKTLPLEYKHEPTIALSSGRNGLNHIKKILHQAGRYLTSKGQLIVECGHNKGALENAFPSVPFTWIMTKTSTSSVFLLSKEDLDITNFPDNNV